MLTKAGSIPDDDLTRLPIDPHFFNAVLSAREAAWELRGCPDLDAAKGD